MARKVLLLAITATLLTAGGPAWGGKKVSPVAYELRRPLGVPLHVVTVNLHDKQVYVTLAVSEGGIGTSERFDRLLARTRPTAALTGTYFSTKTLVPVGDLVAQGRVVNRGRVGSALALTAENRAVFITLGPSEKADFSDYRLVLRGGPRLLADGEVAVSLEGEGFRDPGFRGRKRRSAVALSEHGKLLLVVSAQPVTVTELAKSLRKLGAREAMALDGGSSAALYHKGRTLVRPRRRLTNVIVVYDSLEKLRQASDRLVPGFGKQG